MSEKIIKSFIVTDAQNLKDSLMDLSYAEKEADGICFQYQPKDYPLHVQCSEQDGCHFVKIKSVPVEDLQEEDEEEILPDCIEGYTIFDTLQAFLSPDELRGYEIGRIVDLLLDGNRKSKGRLEDFKKAQDYLEKLIIEESLR